MAASIRQRPGLACEECRRRKARCDRARPICGSCIENGTACIVNEKRPQRGPKKGQLQALRSRVGKYRFVLREYLKCLTRYPSLAMLERQLVGQLDGFDEEATKPQPKPASTPPFEEIPVPVRDRDTTMLHQDSFDIGTFFSQTDGRSPDLTDLSDFQEFPELSPNFTNVDAISATCMDWHTAGGIIMSNIGTTTPVKHYEAIPTLIADNLCLPALVRADLYVFIFPG